MIPFPGGFVKHFFTNFATIFCMLLSRTVVRSWRIFSPHAPRRSVFHRRKQRDKLEFGGLKKMLSLRTQTEACHCEPVRTLANPPDFQDTIIEQLPLFFCVYGRTGPVLADRKIRGIATPACALVRNDMFYFSAINTNLSYRTDTCSAPFRAAISADGIAKRTETHWQRALPAKHQFIALAL